MKKLLLCMGLVLLAPMFVQAQEYQAGTHYDVLSPALRGRNADKIEVLEFFAYSCGHCYNFEPLLQKWKQGLAADVEFQPSPAIWNASMEPHAKAFYTAQALGVLDTVHGALFATIHVDKKRLSSEAKSAGSSGYKYSWIAGRRWRSSQIAYRAPAPESTDSSPSHILSISMAGPVAASGIRLTISRASRDRKSRCNSIES